MCFLGKNPKPFQFFPWMINIKKSLDLEYPKHFNQYQNSSKNLMSINFALKDPFDALAWYEC